MEILKINGGKKLYGKVKIQNSKNATLPILTACLLCDGVVKLKGVPNITDVDHMVNILSMIGVEIIKYSDELILNPKKAANLMLDCELSKSMRSSVFLLGPYLKKFKSMMITMPGGCRIGARPIDIHLDAFRKFGVKIKTLGNYIFFDAKNVKATTIKLRFPSVGATENIIQFAVKLKGKTTILNAAKEPEIIDLCNFLNNMGAKIFGAGTSRITIYGVHKLNSTTYKPMPDRIVAGTIMCAVAACGGEVKLYNTRINENKKLVEKLVAIGCQIKEENGIISVSREDNLKHFGEICTGCYPDFATDLQSIILPLVCLCKGEGGIVETIFENRFLTADELVKMRAKIIRISNNSIKITGVSTLFGADLIAHDLRGGAGLVVAALAANGESSIRNIEYIDRGYEAIEQIFKSLGADIVREKR